jgi:lycopene cyclase domain-containing protein
VKYAYLLILLLTICCLVLVDYRYKLAFFYQRRRTIKTLATAWAAFLAWDLAGVALGIFFPGQSRFSPNVHVLPGVALEELFFLLLFVYLTLLLWRGMERYADLRRS